FSQFDELKDAAGVADLSVGKNLLIDQTDFQNGYDPTGITQSIQYEVFQEISRHHNGLKSLISDCISKHTGGSNGAPDQFGGTVHPGSNQKSSGDASWSDLLGQAAYNLYNSEFTLPGAGAYNIWVAYHLPNGTQTSSATIQLVR
ncbi:MAG: hypothetical protein AAFN92_14705, partial [Bacteroidota bacterium]